MSKKLASQDENVIEVLQFPDNIRQVAGMYIGDAGDCSNILREAVDNAIDELAFVPTFNQVIINAAEDGSSFLVADWGRGMPINMHHTFKDQTSARVATSHVNAGGKFNKTKNSAGQNGTGIKTTNALSETFILMVKLTESNYKDSLPIVKQKYEESDKKDLYYYITYHKGIYDKEDVAKRDELSKLISQDIPEDASTVVYFEPDYSLVKKRSYKLPIYNFRYKAFEMKEYHNRDISILCNGKEMVTELEHYRFVVKHTFTKLHKAVLNKKIDLYFSFDISTDLRSKTYKGSVNSLVVNDGIHIKDMAVRAIRKAISQMTGCENTIKLEQGLKVRSILNAVKVDFKSQIKEYCNVVDGWDESMYEELVPKVIELLEPHKKFIKDYVTRINELDATYKKLKDKKYIEERLRMGNTGKKMKSPPRNLFEASGNGKELPELFLVEGRSAGGTMVKARDVRMHAIYALRGRPLNAVGLSMKAMIKNQEMAKLYRVINMGVNGHVQLKGRRYSKIILAADSDAYGGLINSSMLVNLAAHSTFLLEMGMVYIAEAPVYQQGGKFFYLSDGLKGFDPKKPFDLFKGLGSMDAEEAKTVFFDKDTRRLIKITPKGIGKAKRFLEKNAWYRRMLAEQSGNLGGKLHEEDLSEYNEKRIEDENEESD